MGKVRPYIQITDKRTLEGAIQQVKNNLIIVKNDPEKTICIGAWAGKILINVALKGLKK